MIRLRKHLILPWWPHVCPTHKHGQRAEQNRSQKRHSIPESGSTVKKWTIRKFVFQATDYIAIQLVTLQTREKNIKHD